MSLIGASLLDLLGKAKITYINIPYLVGTHLKSRRAIFQSIEDLNSITYVEEWNDLVLLKSSFKGSRFNFIFGAVKNLADEWEMEVLENMKVKDLESLTI